MAGVSSPAPWCRAICIPRRRLDPHRPALDSSPRGKRGARMRHLRTLGSVLVLLPALAASSQAAKPVSHDDAASCAALAGQMISARSKIESAEYLPGGGTIGTTKVALPLCRLVGVATPTPD